MQFADRLNRFSAEIFAALNQKKLELDAGGRKVYNMSVGTPDFVTPEHIRKALAEAAMDPENWKYSLRDIPELLDSVCRYYKKRYGVDIEPSQVMSCYGTQEGVGHLFFRQEIFLLKQNLIIIRLQRKMISFRM